MVAAALRWTLPTSPQVIYDEFWYLATAHHIHMDGTATPFLLNDLPPVPMAMDEFRPPYPQGWPFLEALALRGGSWNDAVQLQRGIGVAASVAIFGMLASESLAAATYAGLGLAVMPAFLRLSQGASAEGASALFVILALWAARSQRFRPGPMGALLVLASCTWVVHFRPENLLYLILLPPIAFFRPRSAPNESIIGRRWIMAGVLVFGLLLAADLTIMANAALTEHSDNFRAVPRAGFANWQDNMLTNLRENAAFFFDGRVLPRWVIAMTLLGTAWLMRRGCWRPLAFYWGWIGLFTVALSPYPFGDFAAANSADTWRFSVQITLPLLLLGARGMEWAAAGATSNSRIFFAAVLAWMALSTSTYWSFVSATNAHWALWDELRTVSEQLRPDTLVVVDDDNAAVALREVFGFQVVVDQPPNTLSLGDFKRYKGPLILLAAGADTPKTWEHVPTDMLWSTGPVDAERVGYTVYLRH